MNQDAKRYKLSEDEGRSWFTYQLKQGFDLSAAVLTACLFDQGSFETFIPATANVADVEFPKAPDVPGSEAALARYLEKVVPQGGGCVVIEDDMQRRADPRIEAPAAFLGDRVIHWCDFDSESGEKAVEAIERGAFGYPLNAFVVAKSAVDLGFVDGEQVPSDLPTQIVSSLLAVIVSAFDATSYALWMEKGLEAVPSMHTK
jgi:hypothetical protein